MAPADEKDLTVAMAPGELPSPDGPEPLPSRGPSDPGSTQLADAAQILDALSVPGSDPDATQLADAAPTRVASARPAVCASSLPGFDDEGAEGDGVDDATRVAPDGIDALDDPYFSPAAPGEELTTAHPIVSIPSPVESLPERKRRLPAWGVVLLVLALIGAAAGMAYVAYERELWGGKTVPEVVGMGEQGARDVLEGLGFAVEVEYRAGDGDFGTVLDCTPGEGLRVDPAGGITLVVAGERAIPAVVGMSEDEASQALFDAGATDVAVAYQNSAEEPGTVLAVDPAAGSAFVSTDQITLTVAQPFTVPNVEGATEEEALAALEAAGLAGSVAYVESDAERGTVVSVRPGVGEQVEGGATIELSVSSPYPSGALSLLEYFEVRPADLSAFLASEGYELRYSSTYPSSGNARAIYANGAGDVLQITNDPETPGSSGSSSGDVLAGGAGVGGVRLAFSASSLPAGATRETEEGVRAVMDACGLTGLQDSCTQEDAQLPESLRASEAYEDAHFICAHGEQGNYTWAVRIGGVGESTGVVVLVAPTAHFSALNLSAYGGSVCDYVAYADLFRK